jgi:hypothetical protein
LGSQGDGDDVVVVPSRPMVDQPPTRGLCDLKPEQFSPEILVRTRPEATVCGSRSADRRRLG